MSEKINIYTDLAIEAREMIDKEDSEIEGIAVTYEKNGEFEIYVTRVDVVNEAGAKQMNKPVGSYFTIESEAMKLNEMETHEEISKILANKIKTLIDLNEDSVVLIVGLGNWNVTPDALGPKVVSKVLVTRHITKSGGVPLEMEGHVRSVCAVSPGVMGITGIETAEIIKGICQRVKPDLVIAIDALAARQTSRINATIQMCDTGVSPGAGMGNKRMAINEETIGAKVIAIGVPTVVDAATLVNDTLDKMLDAIIKETEVGSEFYDMLKHLESEEKYGLIMQVLDPYKGNMFVTPKEVDQTIERLSGMIASAINRALQPHIPNEEIVRFLY